MRLAFDDLLYRTGLPTSRVKKGAHNKNLLLFGFDAHNTIIIECKAIMIDSHTWKIQVGITKSWEKNFNLKNKTTTTHRLISHSANLLLDAIGPIRTSFNKPRAHKKKTLIARLTAMFEFTHQQTIELKAIAINKLFSERKTKSR